MGIWMAVTWAEACVMNGDKCSLQLHDTWLWMGYWFIAFFSFLLHMPLLCCKSTVCKRERRKTFFQRSATCLIRGSKVRFPVQRFVSAGQELVQAEHCCALTCSESLLCCPRLWEMFCVYLLSRGEGRFAGAERSLCCSWVWGGDAVKSTEQFSASAQLLGLS